MVRKISFFIFCSLVLVTCIPCTFGQNEYPTENSVFVNGLRAKITSPATVTANEYFEVNIYARNNVIPIDLFVDSITVQISGAGISWTDEIATNREITGDWEYNQTAVVKTFENIEGGRPITLSLEFHFMDRYRDDSYVHSTVNMEIARVGEETTAFIAKSTYDGYVQSHSYSNSEYEYLQAQLNADEQTITDNGSTQQYMIYGLLATTAVFIVTTIYFAKRKTNQS